MSGNRDPAITLEHVSKIYKMGDLIVPALTDASLTIQSGEMVAIVGPSGSGKSTLMNVLGCLDVPTSGRYLLGNEDVSQLNDNRLAKIRNTQIGFIFQTYNLLPRLTALSNVELPLLYSDSRGSKERCVQALKRVGLGERVNHKPSELSGGEQQRVGIARAIVKQPSLILADEPTGNLDSHSSNEIVAILQDLNETENLTVVIVTHDPEVANCTNRIISMRDGQITDDNRVQNPIGLKKSKPDSGGDDQI